MIPTSSLFVAAAIAVLSAGNAITSISAYSEGRSMPARRATHFHNQQQQDFIHGTGRNQWYYYNNNNNFNDPQQRYGREGDFYNNHYYQPEYQGYNAEMDNLQGQSRRSYNTYGQRTQLNLATEHGRPMDANVEMWDGPGNASHQTRFWSEDGRSRPFQATTMANSSPTSFNYDYYDESYNARNIMDVQNRGSMEYPLQAGVQPDLYTPPGYTNQYYDSGGETIQGGGTVKHFQIDPSVSSARVSITSTSGMPIEALVELLQGPGRVAQLAEVYDQHGETFSTVVQTPGYGSTIAIKNNGPMEYPVRASVEPLSYDGQGGAYGGDGGGIAYGSYY